MVTFVSMLKRLTAIILLVALISSNFSMFMVYAGFKANQKYIAENLCINKSRPWLHCNGKCYFMKKVRQAEESQKKQQSKNNLNHLELSFFLEPLQVSAIAPNIIGIDKRLSSTYTHQYSSRYIETNFRPPKQTV